VGTSSENPRHRAHGRPPRWGARWVSGGMPCLPKGWRREMHSTTRLGRPGRRVRGGTIGTPR
jgi:hypothetical protein